MSKLRTSLLILSVMFVAGCLEFPDPEPSCPDECVEVHQGDALTECRCVPDYFGDLITEEECEEQKEESLREECE